ncbi:cyclopropane-fatty-acyl-phospholipid synthase family protein [Nocardioides rotundus]|uniref:SAM-dependent methyltransferase n=1 Tax=Nocardioides rotundus TaxID=1774216 RepID=UPI001CC108F4|nr:cyclopropane-fatty-acyl-phospholipid synthase family protein [Nocardioides rotundus]UAL30132.1 cyclopropane-fatty-acyl-phospholipid synthase family protein [Nocardioides rotundus]
MTITRPTRSDAVRPSLADWPGLHEPPTGLRAAAAARVARGLFTAAVSRLEVSVQVDGRTLGRGGPAMVVHRPEELFTRIGTDGLIGFGEAYLTGAWDAPDLGGFLTVLAARMADLVPRPLQRLRGLHLARPPRAEESSVDNARDNIAHHYDLSNELFATFLDQTYSYSSALFATPESSWESQSLQQAQERKIERLLDATGVGDGTRVLEIGTGWGELAIRAAQRGARVHSITLSSEQQALARERIAAAGVADRVEVELRDYRDVAADGAYDVVLSVEMIEAVGYDYWPTYFTTIDRLLAPGGRAGIQAITMPHDRMLATRHTWTWIQKYVFPGGFLPSVEAIEQVTRERTTLRVTERTAFGRHYAETLRRWDDAFLAAADRVAALGFDETFRRMWHFYLEYSRAGFASGYLDVSQIVLEREAAR